ncbi:MAG TPA: flagellar biosynthesis anti-sigma factor FlgM [Nitrospiraceae bacterium]|nr:flagellar biosynthesis anti-sigma factor FlgM [Nitrospiraceae bacterium]
MKIYGNKPPEGLDRSAGADKTTRGPQKTQTSGTDKLQAADKVDISGQGKEIADIMASVNQLPDVRTDKVNQVRQAIESGSYSVDPSKVAQKILREI